MPLQIVISKADLLKLLNGAALVYEVGGVAVDISLAQPTPPDPPQAREFLPARRRGEAQMTDHAPEQECIWQPDPDGTYVTSCGHAFVFTLGGPRDNGARYCLYCGGVLREMADV